MSGVLAETLGDLEDRGLVSGRVIRRVSLTPYFSVVHLEDGCVGAALSYSEDAHRHTEFLERRLPRDPLLLELLFGHGERGPMDANLLRAVAVAVLGALSSTALRPGVASGVRVETAIDLAAWCRGSQATVIGFGGWLGNVLESPAIRCVHVSDLAFASRRGELKAAMEQYRSRYPDKEITISDGRDNAERARASDLLVVTGSALCNGTMEGLLEAAAPDTTVVVQGQSAGMLPTALFRRGADLVVTTRKPAVLAELANSDPTGMSLRRSLEGGLPWLYLHPEPPEPPEVS